MQREGCKRPPASPVPTMRTLGLQAGHMMVLESPEAEAHLVLDVYVAVALFSTGDTLELS